VWLLVSAGCGAPLRHYAEILEVTEQLDYLRIPVIIIPGIKGTQLIEGERGEPGTVRWGLSGNIAGFSGFNALTLDYEKIAEGENVDFARYYVSRRIHPGEVLMAYRIGWTWLNFHDFIIYRDLKDFLTEEGGFSDDSKRGRSLFLFPYDWRLDNRIAAVKLALALPGFRRDYQRLLELEYCERRKGALCSQADLAQPDRQKEFSDHLRALAEKFPDLFTRRPGQPPEIRFHIVAHSMGGLVAQYFMTNLEGYRDVSRLVTLGTPTKGAMDSLKAFAEGEYPDTLLSQLFGFLLFERRATNFITISFPASFQLLPRYPGAMMGLTPEQLGLAGPLEDLASRRFDAIFRTYEQYALVPDLAAVGRALGKRTPEIHEKTMRRHFQTQLTSAACFHEALDGNATRECAEPDRVRTAIRFLRGADPDAVPEDAARRLEAMLDSPGLPREIPRIVYGGHCNETTTRARFEPPNKIRFLGSRGGGDSPSAVEPIFFGDGRVPVYSSQIRRPNEVWRGSFFLCTDHVGLVKDDSFKYNLLRVLTRSEDLEPKRSAPGTP
jgi:pimeloyl-ACP methyl ester carboxylesterase